MIRKVFDLYTYAMEKGADPRVRDLFLMNSPVPTLAIVAVYLIAVTKIGPKLMENRKPFDLKNVLTAYNAIQVVLSSFLLYINISAGWLSNYSIFKCQDVNFSPTDPYALMGMRAAHFYFLSKLTEFFDTIFFVMRKKNNQITFLHLFHHSQVPIFSWICVKFFPGGSITMGMAENSFIHVVMYTYYLLAGLGPHMQKYLWWKKYLTTMQLGQFVFAMLHIMLILFGDCKTLYKPFIISGFFYILALYVLFKKFYDKSYVQDETTKKIH